MVIASAGQASTQAAQSTHSSRSIRAFSSAISIASLGHSSTQVSQPVHFSISTFAGIYTTLSKNDKNLTVKIGMLQDYYDFTTIF
jgi:hypothetical protein